MKLAKIRQAGAELFCAMNGNYALSNDLTVLGWLLDIGVIESIITGGRRAKYMGKLTG